MMISTKGRYALLVMVDLAQHKPDEYVPLQEIADHEQISEKYLETILKVLVKAGLVVGMRGKGGGYRLTRRPDQYSVGEILRLEEDSLAPVSCLDQSAKPCGKSKSCPTLPMWIRLDRMINDFFDSISIAQLMESPDQSKGTKAQEAFTS